MFEEKKMETEKTGVLSEKVALVTGSSKNIGRAIAVALSQSGAKVAVHYIQDAAGAEETANLIRSFGGTAEVFQGDIQFVSEIEEIISGIKDSLGDIDILVNNVGIRMRTALTDITEKEWDEVLSVNLKAPFFMTKLCAPSMMTKKWGRIINISGIDAYWGKANRAHCVSSKAGLIGLTRATAQELARYGITANTIVPGAIDTKRVAEWYPQMERFYKENLDRIPLGRLGTVEEVASACLYLASPESSYITGQTLNVTGGAIPLVRVPYDEEV